MEGQFRLISCVDPSKTPHQLKERFAKLTLSKSSKKKDEIRYGNQQESPTESVLTSKKLFDDLLTDGDDESDKDEDGAAKESKNKIFMSQTSARKSLSFSQKLILSSDDSDATFCSAESTERESIGDGAMEQLRISSSQDTQMDRSSSQPIFTQNDEKEEVIRRPLDDSLTKLSSQIGSMALKSPMKPESSKKTDKDALTETKVFRNLQDDDTKVDTDESILTISSSNSTPQKMECKSPENVPTSGAEEEVIVLSDTDAEAEEASRIVSSIGRPTDVGLSASAMQRLNQFFDRYPTNDFSIENSIENRETFTSPIKKHEREEFTPSQHIKSMETVESPMTTNFSKTSSSDKLKNSFEESVHDASDEVIHESIELSETSCEEENEPKEALRNTESDIIKSTNSTVQETPAATPAPTPRSSVASENFVESINISAKINIKIHISQTNLSDSSENSENFNSEANGSGQDRKSVESQSSHRSNTSSEEIKSKSNESSVESEHVTNMKCLENLKLEKDESLLNDKDLEKNSTEEQSDSGVQNNKNPLEEAESPPEGSILLNEREKNILDKVYGKQWQTPKVLKKIDPKSPIAQLDFEESSLGDFTLFHKNIRTDLESTRLPSLGNDGNFKKPIGNLPRSLPKVPVARITRAGRKVFPKLQTICDPDTSSEEEKQDDYDDSSDEFWKKDVEKEESRTRKGVRRKKKDEIVYLDLTSEVVQEVNGFQEQNVPEPLKDILKSCEYVERKKLPSTPTASNTKGKRKLFTPFGHDDDELPQIEHTFEKSSPPQSDSDGVVKLKTPLPIFTPINRKLEAIKNFKPSSSSTKKTKDITSSDKKRNDTPSKSKKKLDYSDDSPTDKNLPETPTGKYGFLKSLDVNVSKKYCHPEAVKYRESYKTKKGDLVEKLYNLYNEKVFKNELDVEISWNKKLLNTAGRCKNIRKKDIRSSRIELSEKVLTSADRLRCTLIHELCHAATWIFNEEHGHGAAWKAWAARANQIFPELPKINVCHQYDIEYKYTYKCVVCDAKSHAHSKSKKVENLRCAYCRGNIEVYLNKKDKEGNVIPTPTREPTGFAKFVKDNYKYHKAPHLNHADVMKILSIEFAAIKVSEKKSDKD